MGLEPMNFSFELNCCVSLNGADKIRTCDNLNANQVLYQLSYNPLYM